MDRVLAGDAEAFGSLYVAHADAVARYLRLKIGDPDLVEDMVADVFLRALSALATLKEPERFRAWLLSIAHNASAGHWRSESRHPAPAPLERDDDDAGWRATEPGEEEPGLRHTEARVDAARLMATATGLTELQCEVLALRFGAGLTIAETADLIGRSPEAAKQLQYRALEVLRATDRSGAAATLPDPPAGEGP